MVFQHTFGRLNVAAEVVDIGIHHGIRIVGFAVAPEEGTLSYPLIPTGDENELRVYLERILPLLLKVLAPQHTFR